MDARLSIVLIVLFLFLPSLAVSQKLRCKGVTLERPEKLVKESEDYFLAWIAYGERGQRAVASLALLDLDGKRQYDVTVRLWKCESEPVIKNALLLALFDQKPTAHVKAVKELVPDGSDRSATLWAGLGDGQGDNVKLKSLGTGDPKPFDEYIKQGYIDYYFNWGWTAAVHLAKKGFVSDSIFECILNLASSIALYSSRQKAEEVFLLFENIPPYDPSPREHLDGLPGALPNPIPTYLEKYERAREEQVLSIRRWYEKNKRKLKWQAVRGKYEAEP